MIKRYIFLLATLLLTLGSWAQKHTLTLSVTPERGGYFSGETTREYEAGATFYIQLNLTTDFQLVRYTLDGEAYDETRRYFVFTMPDHDATLQAEVEYAPATPGDPTVDVKPTLYTLTVKTEPEKLNIADQTYQLEAGTTKYLSASTPSDYILTGTYDVEADTLVTTQRAFYFTMPDHDMTLRHSFEYYPGTPGNPQANGTVNLGDNAFQFIMDDFQPGQLYTKVQERIKDHGIGSNQVQQLIVGGKVTASDFSIQSYLPACEVYDYTRTNLEGTNSYALLNNTAVQAVKLPESLTTLGYGTFKGCANLTSLTCLAMTPPKLDRAVFDDVPEAMVVYVRAASVLLYMADPDWGRFTIQPVKDDMSDLTIRLPEEASDGRCENMYLQVTNTKSGVRQRYVVSDRMEYTFELVRGTVYDVSLSNARGDVLSQLDGIELNAPTVSASLPALLPTRDVTLRVLLPDGTDVTNLCNIKWYDTKGNTVSTLSSLLEGTILWVELVLDRNLAVDYATPIAKSHTVNSGDNVITMTLTPFVERNFTGQVLRAEDETQLSGATVTANQQLYNATNVVTAVTDAQGYYTLKLKDAEGWTRTKTIITTAAPYRKTSKSELTLLPANGSLKKTLLDEEDRPMVSVDLDGYDQPEDVRFEVRNHDTQQVIEGTEQQGTDVMLPVDHYKMTPIDVVAYSLAGRFAPTASTMIGFASVNNTSDPIRVILKRYGSLTATCEYSGSEHVHASVYDSEGRLVASKDYDGRTVKFDYLPDGEYTLVSMGESRYYQSLNSLALLGQVGLNADVDYAAHTFTMKTGKPTELNVGHVPTFVESHFYYTGDRTSFSCTSTNPKAGSSLTFRTRLDFKDIYSRDIKDVRLHYYWDNGTDFLDGSAVVNNQLSGYTADSRSVTIEDVKAGDDVKFCLLPSADGELHVTATAEFYYQGNRIKQPIGSATVEVASVKLSIASKVAVPSVNIKLSNIPTDNYRTIEIYDNGMLIGTIDDFESTEYKTTLVGSIFTSSRGDNTTIVCPLYNAYYYSTHAIQAKLKGTNDKELITQTAYCLYDPTAIHLIDVSVGQPGHGAVIANHVTRTLNRSYYDIGLSGSSKHPRVGLDYWAHFNYNPNILNIVKKIYFSYHYYDKGKRHVGGNNMFLATCPDRVWYDEGVGYNRDAFYASHAHPIDKMPVNISVDYDLYDEIRLPKDTVAAKNTILGIMQAMMKETEKLTDSLRSVTAEIDAEMAKPTPDMTVVDNLQKSQSDYICRLNGGGKGKVSATEQRTAQQWLNATDASSQQQLWSNMFPDVSKTPDYQQAMEYSQQMHTSSYASQPRDIGNGAYLPGVEIQVANPKTGNMMQDLGSTGWHYDDNSSGNRFSFTNDNGDRLTMDFGAMDLSSTSALSAALDAISHDLEVNIYSDISGKIAQALGNKIGESAILGVEAAFKKQNAILNYIAEEAKALGWDDVLRKVMDERKLLGEEVSKWTSTDFGKIGSTAAGAAIGGFFGGKSANGAMNELLDDDNAWDRLINRAEAACGSNLDKDFMDFARDCKSRQKRLNGCNVVVNTASAVLGVLGSGLGLTIVGLGIDAYAAEMHAEHNAFNQKAMKTFVNAVNSTPGCEKIYLNEPATADFSALIDPSGYVYEAVSSNRLEGVTATIFHRDSVQNEYGDWEVKVEQWDAESFDQENPQLTDAAGKYGWDVPAGLWQVKYEKEGYETAYSEWLPVPPPQLEVDIAMTQLTTPEVKEVHAYQDGVELQFDKYMQPETLTPENIYLKVRRGDDETLIKEGTVVLLDEEPTYKQDTVTYASKLRYTADVNWTDADEVTIIVDRHVKSYAGIAMQQTFMQPLDVELRIEDIQVDSLLAVAEGLTKTMHVQVLPSHGLQGRTLRAQCQADSLIVFDSETVELDENGEADLTFTGLHQGSALVMLSIDGADASGETIVEVVNPDEHVTAAPVASLEDGATVEAGTTVDLSCATEGAAIWYTLDGSCPCDETTRLVYDGTPIVLAEAGDVTLRMIAVADGYTESESQTYLYHVKEPTGISTVSYSRSAGKAYNLSGQRVLTPRKGVYVVDGKKKVVK